MSPVPQRNGLRDSSTGELVRQLSDQVSQLVRQELELAKAEMGRKGREAGAGAGYLGGRRWPVCWRSAR